MTPAERYAHRKRARLCIDCGAGLQETDGMTCVEHAAIRDRAARKYRGTDKGRARDAAWKAREYDRRIAAGLCVQTGCKALAVDGKRRCGPHGEEHKVASAYYERQGAA